MGKMFKIHLVTTFAPKVMGKGNVSNKYLMLTRYVKEWTEYKKTDSYKEFRRQQLEQKDSAGATKKAKHNTPHTVDTTANTGNSQIIYNRILFT